MCCGPDRNHISLHLFTVQVDPSPPEFESWPRHRFTSIMVYILSKLTNSWHDKIFFMLGARQIFTIRVRA